MAPIAGADGVPGSVFITTLADAAEVHPTELVTEYEYVPAVKPDIVLLMPLPAIPPGLMVQFPEGKSVKIMLPVATEQFGCKTDPIVGAVGVTGWALITTFAEAEEVHPAALVKV